MKQFLFLALTLSLIACSSDNENGNGGGGNKLIFGNLMVQESDISSGVNGFDAISVCENSYVGGYSDWRLPSVAELGVIYSNKSSIPGLYSSYYWSYEECENGHYNVSFDNGSRGCNNSSSPSYKVRCVRNADGSGQQGNSSSSAATTELTIFNQSSYDIKDVLWNNVSFGEVKKGHSVKKNVTPGSSYLYFTISAENMEVRLEGVVDVNQGDSEEKVIINTTRVVEIANVNNVKELNLIEATPPVFGSLMVQTKDLSTSANWSTADDICKDSKVAGYSDWRLPIRSELTTIYNNKAVIGGLNVSSGSSSYYWSSELQSLDSYYGNYYYYLSMYNNSISWYRGAGSFHVRCVRSVGDNSLD